MQEFTEEAKKFWAEKEKEKGGKLSFFTFATYLGMSSKRSPSLGGLLYIIDNKIYFEDFEKDNWLIKIIGRKQKYEKTEFSINIKDISETKVISRNSAFNCMAGYIKGEETRALSPFLMVLMKPILQISLKNKNSLFFEIMKLQDFLKTVGKTI